MCHVRTLGKIWRVGGLAPSPLQEPFWGMQANEVKTYPAFNIHSESSLGPNIFAPAPSRPPSRVNNRETIDLTAEHAAADPRKSLTAEEREAEDMKQAMELSMSGNFSQENGVTGATEFGPATKEYYDNQNWAMTVSGSAHEIVLNPEPADRKLEGDQPAFLKPSPSGQYLAPLLTILHSIPLANETLLFRGLLLPEYGQENEWWDGTAVKLPKVVDLANGWSDDGGDEIIHETQRLMAFLSMTERAYGSVEVLAHLKNVIAHNEGKAVGNYLQAWQEAATQKNPEDPNISLFHSLGTRVPFDGSQMTRQPFVYLDVPIDEDMAEQGFTLYDALDDIIWAETQGGQDIAEIFLESIGEVFTMRLMRQNQFKTSIDIRIPAVWYPDRYLKSCKDMASLMRTQKIGLITQIAKIEQSQATLLEYHQSSGDGKKKSMDAGKLLQTAIDYFEQPPQPKLHLSAADMDEDMEMGSLTPIMSHAELAGQLKAISDRVTRKLQLLDQQKEVVRANLRKLSAMLTEPSSDPENPPHHLYTLRGVSTEPHITYVLRPLDPATTDNTPDAVARGWQWWKLSYSNSETKPLSRTASPPYKSSSTCFLTESALRALNLSNNTAKNPSYESSSSDLDSLKANIVTYSKQKVPEIQVLKAARVESRTVLLVYASEKAVHFKTGELPPQLQNFVRADNLAFCSELEATHSADMQERASSKQKADDDSSGDSWGGDPNYPIEPLTGPSDPMSRSYAPTSATVSRYFSRTLEGNKDHDVRSEDDHVDGLESRTGGQEMKELGKGGFVANAMRSGDSGGSMLLSDPSTFGTQNKMIEDSDSEGLVVAKHIDFADDVSMK
ncbi:MAG: hypothetical protein M1836_002421 [Candelina mexicana]|nr:MAG: hypothetical protein M1836_002421 [Candelina mexicana]